MNPNESVTPAGPPQLPRRPMTDGKLLMITSIAGAAGYGAALGVQIGFTVTVVGTRREAVAALRTQTYSAMIVDDAMAESDPVGSDLMRRHGGMAVVLEANFAISSVSRLARDVRSALARREHEQRLAMRAASAALEGELRTTVAGILLQSQLALAEAASSPQLSSPQLSSRVQQIAELAAELRRRLEAHSAGAASVVRVIVPEVATPLLPRPVALGNGAGSGNAC